MSRGDGAASLAPGSEPPRPLSEPMLYWVVRGRVTIVSGEHAVVARAGDAVWVERGAAARVDLPATSIVVPIPGITLPSGSACRVIRVPEEWSARLLYAFGGGLGYFDDDSAGDVVAQMLQTSSESRSYLAAEPTSAEMFRVSQRIRRAPDRIGSLAEEAARAGMSARTLQRRFVAETGVGFTQWVRQARADRGARELLAGRDLQWAANAVGYETASGFSRMFHSVTGESPVRWRERRPGREESGGPGAQERARGHAGGASTPEVEVPQLPAVRSWRRSNGGHVAVWVVCGTATFRIGARRIEVRAGQGLVIPAGYDNDIVTSVDALVLPIGFRSGRSGAVGKPISPASFSDDEVPALIAHAVDAYTTVRCSGGDAPDGFQEVLARSETDPVSDDDHVFAQAASIATRDVAGECTIAACASEAGMGEDELRRIIHERTDTTFSGWLRLIRMSQARTHLHDGKSAAAVARDVGYAQPQAFSRAFPAVHGTSPQDHVLRGSRPAPITAQWRAELKLLRGLDRTSARDGG